MKYLDDAILLIALVIIVEKAAVVHTKIYMSIALNFHGHVTSPPLFRPVWRVGVYAFYLIAGLAAVEQLVPIPIGLALILLPIALLVSLDLRALRRNWAEQAGRNGDRD
jgi:hypothetical protein